jgi:hypothetical protein
MKLNVGRLDRSARIAAGVVLVGLGATGAVGAWGYVGVLPLLTGLVGFCPAYSVFGIDTCSSAGR